MRAPWHMWLAPVVLLPALAFFLYGIVEEIRGDGAGLGFALAGTGLLVVALLYTWPKAVRLDARGLRVGPVKLRTARLAGAYVAQRHIVVPAGGRSRLVRFPAGRRGAVLRAALRPLTAGAAFAARVDGWERAALLPLFLGAAVAVMGTGFEAQEGNLVGASIAALVACALLLLLAIILDWQCIVTPDRVEAGTWPLRRRILRRSGTFAHRHAGSTRWVVQGAERTVPLRVAPSARDQARLDATMRDWTVPSDQWPDVTRVRTSPGVFVLFGVLLASVPLVAWEHWDLNRWYAAGVAGSMVGMVVTAMVRTRLAHARLDVDGLHHRKETIPYAAIQDADWAPHGPRTRRHRWLTYGLPIRHPYRIRLKTGRVLLINTSNHSYAQCTLFLATLRRRAGVGPLPADGGFAEAEGLLPAPQIGPVPGADLPAESLPPPRGR